MKRAISLMCILALCLCFAGCGAGEETALTGMVVSVEGTTVSLAVFDGQGEGGERPERPEGREDFENFGEGEMPSVPGGEMPSVPEGEMPSMPEGETPPERPEGEKGERPEGGQRPQGGGREFDGETTQVDLANAKITVQFDGGKAVGSMDDITQGVFLTVTLSAKGEAVTAVVTEMTGFGQRGQKQ